MARLYNQIAHGVDIEACIARVRCFGAEEDDEGQQDGSEDGDEVECLLVAYAVCDHADEDWGQEGAAEEREVGECHADSALMDMVQIADRCVDECLERREAHALEDSRPEERCVVRSCCAAPYAAKDHNNRTEDVEMPLPPDARTWYEEEACDSNTEEVVPCQESHVRKAALEVDGQRDGVGGKERRQSCCDDGEEREDEDDDIAFP